MVGFKSPVSLFISFNTFSDFNNLTCYLMSQYNRGFFDAIPLHYITAADTACNNLYKKFSVTYLWNGSFFKSDIFIIMINCNSHITLYFFFFSLSYNLFASFADAFSWIIARIALIMATGC